MTDAPITPIGDGTYVAISEQLWKKLMDTLQRHQQKPKCWRVHVFLVEGTTRKAGWTTFEYADDQLQAEALAKARIIDKLDIMREFDELWTCVERAFTPHTNTTQ